MNLISREGEVAYAVLQVLAELCAWMRSDIFELFTSTG